MLRLIDKHVSFSFLRQNLGPECRQRTGSTASRDTACSPKTTAGAHEELQRDHLKPNAASGLVIVCQRSGLFRSQEVSRRLFFRQPIDPTSENRIIKSLNNDKLESIACLASDWKEKKRMSRVSIWAQLEAKPGK